VPEVVENWLVTPEGLHHTSGCGTLPETQSSEAAASGVASRVEPAAPLGSCRAACTGPCAASGHPWSARGHRASGSLSTARTPLGAVSRRRGVSAAAPASPGDNTQEGQEDVRLDAPCVLVVDRPEGQVPLQGPERLLHPHQLHVEPPEGRRVRVRQIGPQQVPAFPRRAARSRSLRRVNRSGAVAVGSWMSTSRPADGDCCLAPPASRGAHPASRGLLQLVQPLPSPLSWPPSHARSLCTPGVALGQDIHLALVGEQLDVDPRPGLLATAGP